MSADTDILASTAVAERFWAKVKIGPGCWEWQAATSAGYGRFRFCGRNDKAHRVSLNLSGTAVPVGATVMHLCNNKRCVRPEHLKIGTHRENILAAAADGLLHPARGEMIGAAKLTEADVLEMRAIYASGLETLASLAVRFGVSSFSISSALRGRTWGHVGGSLVSYVPGRRCGERNPRAKLRAHEVSEIRYRVSRGESRSAVARSFGVSRSTVSQIASMRIWKHANAEIAQ